MLALRVARAATGRDRIVKLQDHFHGWSDAVTPYLDADGHTRTPVGVPEVLGALTTVVRTDEPADLEATLARGDVAAVIMEASGAHYGQLPLDRSFISAARDACTATGTALVFDEVVTGFRVAPGGMQSLLGITPDISVLGKVMSGGLPSGAVAGQADLLELLAPTIAPPAPSTPTRSVPWPASRRYGWWPMGSLSGRRSRTRSASRETGRRRWRRPASRELSGASRASSTSFWTTRTHTLGLPTRC